MASTGNTLSPTSGGWIGDLYMQRENGAAEIHSLETLSGNPLAKRPAPLVARHQPKRGPNGATRERILGCAKDLFLRKGMAGTSVDEIVAASGLTKGGIFYHFRSKNDLSRTLLERFSAQDIKMFQDLGAQADSSSDDPIEALLNFISGFEQYIAKEDRFGDGSLLASYLYESELLDADTRQLISSHYERVRALISERVERAFARLRTRPVLAANEVAELYISTIEGGFVLSRGLKDPSILARQVRTFSGLLGSIIHEHGA